MLAAFFFFFAEALRGAERGFELDLLTLRALAAVADLFFFLRPMRDELF